jgi:hypothetical protein
MYIKKLVLLKLFCMVTLMVLANSPIKDTTAFSGDYRIVLNADASVSEKWAATELQQWLYKISNEYLAIQNMDTVYKGHKIVLGYNDIVKLKTDNAAPAFDDEAYEYFSSEGDIYIYGGKERGTMYGVFSFLENEFGCRWYTPQVSVIPKKAKLVFGDYNYKSAPGITVRNDFYFEAFDAVWAARNKMNGRMFLWDPRNNLPKDGVFYKKQIGGEETYWSVHTFYPLMPAEEFFDNHPEYYSLIEGKRTHDDAQLCLSNKDVLKIMIERVKLNMRKYPDFMIYDVSQNDCYKPCQCDKCQAIVKKEGAESGIIIWFVNQVAEAVEKEFPGKYVGTLAYQYSRTPPKNIKPRENVVVRLCPIEACVAHDLKSCERNKSFLDDLQKWASISPHLYIWDYVVNFAAYTMPYPSFAVLQSNIKTFKENKSIGIMEQAAYQSRGGEFAELKSYLLAKLLWNPDVNTKDVIDDFIYGYYGRSGIYIKQYFYLAQNLITPQVHMKIGVKPDDKMFTDEFVHTSMALFKDADQVADNEDIRSRVALSSLSVLYLKCMRNPVASRKDGTYAEVLRIIDKEGVTLLSESTGTIDRFKKIIEAAK